MCLFLLVWIYCFQVLLSFILEFDFHWWWPVTMLFWVVQCKAPPCWCIIQSESSCKTRFYNCLTSLFHCASKVGSYTKVQWYAKFYPKFSYQLAITIKFELSIIYLSKINIVTSQHPSLSLLLSYQLRAERLCYFTSHSIKSKYEHSFIQFD